MPKITPRRSGSAVELTGLVERHLGGGQGELGEAVGAPGLLDVVEVGLGVEVVDPALPSGAAASRPSQNASAPMPQRATTPTPVTATRRPSIRACA